MRHIILRVSSSWKSCVATCRRPPAEAERGYWTGKFDFLLATIGYMIGVGNIFGFPHLCFSNGAVAFLIPYIIVVVLAGVPLVFLEMALGQYTNMGPVHGWRTCPIMTGVGWGMFFIAASSCVSYALIISWSFCYTFASISSKLPWSDCKNLWNDKLCKDNTKSLTNVQSLEARPCSHEVTVNCTRYETPSSQYFERMILGFVSYTGDRRTMSDPLGKVQWPVALCLLLTWTLAFLSLMKGIKSMGKVVHVTSVLPIAILLTVLVGSATLPGSALGIKAFFTPDFSYLMDSKTWTTATAQAFYSLSGFGGIMTLASYNRIHNNCHRDAIIASTVDTVASILSSLAVFSILGYMAHRTGQPVSSMVLPENGLSFTVYADAAITIPVGQVWSFLFFLMLVGLGIDTLFIYMVTVMTAIQDQWPQLRQSLAAEIGTKAAVCGTLFLCGLPMCCEGGIFVFAIFQNYVASFNLYAIALGEILGVSCFYGMENFLNDIKTMLGYKPGFYWVACWTVITPVLLGAVFIFSIVKYKRPTVAGNEPMTDWGEAAGWALMMVSMLIVIAFAIMWRPIGVGRESRQSVERENRVMRAMTRSEPGGGSGLRPASEISDDMSRCSGLSNFSEASV